MSIEEQLKSRLKDAIRNRDLATANTIRMINTRLTERRTAKGFSGEVNDELYLEVIAAYKKSMEKAKKELEGVGERGAEQAADLQREIDFCAQFLPELLDESTVRGLVRAAISELGVSDQKMAGRVIGAVVKANKGRVNPAQVKQIVQEELGKGSEQ
jgi:uncharacterized protein YqeY